MFVETGPKWLIWWTRDSARCVCWTTVALGGRATWVPWVTLATWPDPVGNETTRYIIFLPHQNGERMRDMIYIYDIYPYWKRVILVITWDFRGFPFWDGWHINQRWIKYFVVNPMLKNQLPMIPRNSLNVCKTVESLFQVLWNIIICRTLRVKYFLVLMLDTTENDDIHFRTFLWFISYPLLKSKTPEITPFRCERINNQSNFNSLLIMLTPHPWFCWTDRSSFTVESQ